MKALRQPGSAFKPFVYLAALESGYTPDSIADDEPITVDGWSPKNHTGTYQGEVTLRDSFAQSINTVAVKLADDVGRRRWCAPRGGSAFIPSCTTARRSRSAPPRSPCSSSSRPMSLSPMAARA